jgi:hypothetical protein
MQACFATKLPWVNVHYTPVTSNYYHTEMQQIFYALLTNTSPDTSSSSAGKWIPILLDFVFSTALSRIRWSDSSQSCLKHGK